MNNEQLPETVLAEEIENFVSKWGKQYRSGDPNPIDVSSYIRKDLNELIASLRTQQLKKAEQDVEDDFEKFLDAEAEMNFVPKQFTDRIKWYYQTYFKAAQQLKEGVGSDNTSTPPQEQNVEELAEKILKKHFVVMNSDSPETCFVDTHPSKIIAAMIEYAASSKQSMEGLGSEQLQLGISQIVDNIVNGNTHPLTAKSDLLKLLGSEQTGSSIKWDRLNKEFDEALEKTDFKEIFGSEQHQDKASSVEIKCDNCGKPYLGGIGGFLCPNCRNTDQAQLCHSLVLSEPMQQEKAWVKAVEPHFPDKKGYYLCLVDIGDCLIEKDCYWNGSSLWNGDLSEVDEIIAWRREEKEPKPSSCSHPRNERTYIGEGYLRCNLCGEEFK
jgi:hypothetical protein